jgi:hypothetical protein
MVAKAVESFCRLDRIIAVNLKGARLCMAAEIRQMQQQGGGAILNTASLAGESGFPTTTGYAASKHGIVGHDQDRRPGICARHPCERAMPRLCRRRHAQGTRCPGAAR